MSENEEVLPVEEDTVPTEEEAKKLQLPKDLKSIQKLFWVGKEEEAEFLLIEKLKYHFNIDLLALRNDVAAYVKENAATLAPQPPYLVPSGDWSKCCNTDEAKQAFFENEASNPDVWRFQGLRTTDIPKVWAILFKIKELETADDFIGYVYVSETGKVKHVFAQYE